MWLLHLLVAMLVAYIISDCGFLKLHCLKILRVANTAVMIG